MYIYIKESKIPFIFSTFDINTNMAKHNTNFGKDLKNLSDLAFSVLNENTNEVINGGAAYKGGDIDHDWASHISAPQFEGVKKILHHNLTEQGIVEEYYVEHNGKLVGLLAEDVIVEKKSTHPKSDEEENHDKDDEEKAEEEEDEETFGSSAHGARPKLIGVPILR